MEQCPDYYLAEPSPGLPAAVAGLIANGFWRAGGHAQFSGGTGSDRWTDVRASGRGKFGLIFRVQPWLLVPCERSYGALPRVAAERPETGRVFGARSEQRSSAIVMLAVSPRLDFAVLFDSWLLNEAEVEPANYIAHVPRSHILADGWYVWDADPSDGFGPVMAHVGATPDAFAALAMLEWHTWGSESWYRMAMADDIGLAFVRPPRLVP